jgi:AcrR family transcriptional regulator
MIAPIRAVDETTRRLRADQIMDAAAELLLKWGYGKVTMDDVARQAMIGKGTVYLHWKTKEELFFSVIAREQLTAVESLAKLLKQDPREAALHRLVRWKFVNSITNPILRAIIVPDVMIMGRLLQSVGSLGSGKQAGLIASDYFSILARHGLLRKDLSVSDVAFGTTAAALGFYGNAPIVEAFAGTTDLERRADLLESVIARTFGPESPPSEETLRAAVPDLLALYEESKEMMRRYLAQAFDAPLHGKREQA